MNPSVIWFRIGTLPISSVVVTTWIIMVMLVAVSAFAARGVHKAQSTKPGLLAEAFVEAIFGLSQSIIGSGHTRYLPLVATTMLFVTISNLSGIVPRVAPPTSDLSTVVALGMLVFLVTQWASVTSKGLRRYVLEYFEPIWWLFPINVVGVIARPVSHIFRLYGNMVGGAILISVISMLAPWIVPVPLLAWFSVFVGVVQAFVFTLLALVYIAESTRGSQDASD